MTSFLGIQMRGTDPSAGTVHFVMPMRAELERLPGSGQFHGGAIASFADTVGDFAVALLVGGPVPTINLRIDFLRPAGGNELLATATVRKMGRSLAVVDVEILDSSARLVAIARGSYSVTIG